MSNAPEIQELASIWRGSHSPLYTAEARRAGSDPDLTLGGTTIEIRGRQRGSSTLLFTKTIGDGVTVVDATHFTFQLEPADTAELTASQGYVDVDLQAWVTEANGIVSPPWKATLRVFIGLD